MEEYNKIPWWQSKTIWIGVAQALIGVMVGLGYMTEGEAAEATSWLQQILGVAVTGLGAASVWARVMARRQIKPEILAPIAKGPVTAEEIKVPDALKPDPEPAKGGRPEHPGGVL